jgi:hypothetical protein
MPKDLSLLPIREPRALATRIAEPARTLDRYREDC